MQAALYKDNEQCGYLDIIWSCQGLTKELQGIINHYCHYFPPFFGCFFFLLKWVPILSWFTHTHCKFFSTRGCFCYVLVCFQHKQTHDTIHYCNTNELKSKTCTTTHLFIDLYTYMNIKRKSMCMWRQRIIQLPSDEMQSPEISSLRILKTRASATWSPRATIVYAAW